MTETDRRVLLAHYIEAKTLSEIAIDCRVSREHARQAITGTWAESKALGPGRKPRFAAELGIRFDRTTMRWELCYEIV